MESTLQEKIRKAIEENNLDAQMSVIRMEATRLNISPEELTQAIEKQVKEAEIQKKAFAAAKRNKYILWAICAVLIILEWVLIFNAHPAEGEKSHFILTLIVNLITLVAVIIGAAVFFRKHN